ncbi:MAG: DUF928 domain-containing protein [Pleurocapsa sp.]
MLIVKLMLGKINCFLCLLIASNLAFGYLVSPLKAETKDGTRTNHGMPTYRRDGGSRGTQEQCVANHNQNIVAIIPENTVTLTASTAPKLFFYISETSQERTLEFVLRNEEDKLIYEAFLTTDGRGIVSVEIPPEVQANLLQEKQDYHWYLSMICNAEQRSQDLVVEGWMRPSQIDPITKKQLAEADVIEQAELYNQQGLWHDALLVLAERKHNYAVAAKWSELLNSVGLGELASKPFVPSKLIEESQGSEITENLFLP